MEDQLPTEINIVTLNCWGLKYLSKSRNERLGEIGRRLATADPAPQIVALQECWCQDDYRSIRRETRFVLPYGKFYHAGVFGGGLAVLSKWPIEESTMFRYPLNGRPTAFFRGDWFVGKGVACAKIRYGPGAKHVVEVFNTHTHAAYKGDRGDSYVVHRTAQAWEFAKLLRGAAERGHLVLGAGDLNAVPASLAHQLVESCAPVRDVWRVLHPDSSLGAADEPAEHARRRPIPTAAYNLSENGATSDSVLNTWRWPPRRKPAAALRDVPDVPHDAIDPGAKRLDYIFASAGDVAALGGAWVVRTARVGMLARHRDLGCSLSDHLSVEAALTFHPSKADEPSAGPAAHYAGADKKNKMMTNGTYLQSPTASTRYSGASFDAQLLAALRRPNDDPAASSSSSPLSGATYDEILTQIHRYMAREHSQRRWRGTHFAAWLAVALGCYVAVWFSPHNYVAFILMLLCSLGLVAGTVDGLIALLFMGSEIRALKEFEWEIMNAKVAASGGPPQVAAEDGGDKVGW